MRDRITLSRATQIFSSFDEAKEYLHSKKDWLLDGECLLARYYYTPQPLQLLQAMKPNNTNTDTQIVKTALGICYTDMQATNSKKYVTVFGDMDEILNLINTQIQNVNIEYSEGENIYFTTDPNTGKRTVINAIDTKYRLISEDNGDIVFQSTTSNDPSDEDWNEEYRFRCDADYKLDYNEYGSISLYHKEGDVWNIVDGETINNSLITITQGGVEIGSFTLNQNSPTTIDLDNTNFMSRQDVYNYVKKYVDEHCTCITEEEVQAIVNKFITEYCEDFVTEGDVYNYIESYLGDYYNKQEVLNLINTVNAFRVEIVSELPEVGDERTIYLVPKEGSEQENVYNEYVYQNGGWELIGDTSINLSGYYTSSQVDNLISSSVNNGVLTITDNENNTKTFTANQSHNTNISLSPVAFSGNYGSLANTPNNDLQKRVLQSYYNKNSHQIDDISVFGGTYNIFNNNVSMADYYSPEFDLSHTDLSSPRIKINQNSIFRNVLYGGVLDISTGDIVCTTRINTSIVVNPVDIFETFSTYDDVFGAADTGIVSVTLFNVSPKMIKSIYGHNIYINVAGQEKTLDTGIFATFAKSVPCLTLYLRQEHQSATSLNKIYLIDYKVEDSICGPYYNRFDGIITNGVASGYMPAYHNTGNTMPVRRILFYGIQASNNINLYTDCEIHVKRHGIKPLKYIIMSDADSISQNDRRFHVICYDDGTEHGFVFPQSIEIWTKVETVDAKKIITTIFVERGLQNNNSYDHAQLTIWAEMLSSRIRLEKGSSESLSDFKTRLLNLSSGTGLDLYPSYQNLSIGDGRKSLYYMPNDRGSDVLVIEDNEQNWIEDAGFTRMPFSYKEIRYDGQLDPSTDYNNF